MSASILELTNRVLRRINEVELTIDTYNSARGIHAFAKDAVLDTIQKMNKEFYQWPFDAAQHTMLLSPGVSEYAWPDKFRTCDWQSFQLIGNLDLYNVESRQLFHIDREVWYDHERRIDEDTPPFFGRGRPTAVFEAHGLGFGVTPSPDKPYQINFRYWTHPTSPSLPADTTNIPQDYEYVIIDGAMFHMKVFKEDLDGAQLYDAKYKEGIKSMKSIYGRKWNNITDRRIQRDTRGFF